MAIREVRHILGVTENQVNAVLRTEDMEISWYLMKWGIIPTVKRKPARTHCELVQCGWGAQRV